MKGGSEVVYLASTAHIKLVYPTRGIYLNTVIMPIGQYFAEYMLVDLDTAEFIGPEDIDVCDIARQMDMTIVRQIELG
jgi:hypothetical protein